MRRTNLLSSVVVVLFSSVAIAAPPQNLSAGDAEKAPVAAKSPTPFGDLPLPFTGEGSVSVTPSGLLSIFVHDVGLKEREPNRIHEWQLFAFQMDRGSTRLAHAGNHWFLDRDGVEIRQHELNADEVVLQAFLEPVTGISTFPIAVVGTVKIEQDASGGTYDVYAVDADSGEVFTTSIAAKSFKDVADVADQTAVAEEAGGATTRSDCSACTSVGCCCMGKNCTRAPSGKTVTCISPGESTTCTDGEQGGCSCQTTTSYYAEWP